jgi:hypothetical protein
MDGRSSERPLERGGRGQQSRLQKAADAVHKLAGERFT